MAPKTLNKKEKKAIQFERIYKVFDKYEKAIIVDVMNISASQIQKVRMELRTIGGEFLMGKNTLICAALTARLREPVEGDRDYETKKKNYNDVSRWECLLRLLTGNVGVIFCTGDFSEIKEVMDSNSRGAPAKIGQVASMEVVVPAGSTGLDPKQTSFFQQLDIQTKIVKSVIEIITPTKIISIGDIVEPGQAALLEKLQIRPFVYVLQAIDVVDNGKVFPAAVLNITTEDIRAKYARALNFVAAISMEAAYPTQVSVRHSITNTFKNLVAVTLESEYSFPQADAFKAAAAAGPAPAAAAEVAAPVEEEKKEEPVADIDMAGAFGDDDEDY